MSRPCPSVALVSSVLVLIAVSARAAPEGEASRAAPGESGFAVQLRRPVCLLVAGDRLLVGNRRSGTVSLLDRQTNRIVAEHRVAERIADMALLDDAGGQILVLDDAAGELRSLRLDDRPPRPQVVARVPTSSVKLAFSRERRELFVAARWSRQLLAFTLDAELEAATSREAIDLPFAPQELLLLPDAGTLLVADAFRGRIALVKVDSLHTLMVRELQGHNIRGLAISPDGTRLHVAHQRMAPRGVADYEEVHWGRLVANVVHVLDLEHVLDADPGQRIDGWLNSQGGIGGATGDPSAVVTGTLGDEGVDVTAVAFAGVGEVALRRSGRERRIRVGDRPDALVLHGERLYVANRFADSVSVVDLRREEVIATVALGPAPVLTAVERGEKLFFDARLSHDGWMSCHSCHTDGHTSELLVDTLGDGDYGAPKKVPSLLGTRDTGPWGWTGSAESLAEQVRKSVFTTMHGDVLSDDQVGDLVAYLSSLEAPPPQERPDEELTRHGGELFSSLACVDCHSLPRFTSEANFDVGLVDERQRDAFNPPSLRGVGQRERLFHDGRARGLEDVVSRFRHQQDRALAEGEVAALLAYLRSL